MTFWNLPTRTTRADDVAAAFEGYTPDPPAPGDENAVQRAQAVAAVEAAAVACDGAFNADDEVSVMIRGTSVPPGTPRAGRAPRSVDITIIESGEVPF